MESERVRYYSLTKFCQFLLNHGFTLLSRRVPTYKYQMFGSHKGKNFNKKYEKMMIFVLFGVYHVGQSYLSNFWEIRDEIFSGTYTDLANITD